MVKTLQGNCLTNIDTFQMGPILVPRIRNCERYIKNIDKVKNYKLKSLKKKMKKAKMNRKKNGKKKRKESDFDSDTEYEDMCFDDKL